MYSIIERKAEALRKLFNDNVSKLMYSRIVICNCLGPRKRINNFCRLPSKIFLMHMPQIYNASLDMWQNNAKWAGVCLALQFQTL